MEIENNYSLYLSKFEKGEYQGIFSAELNVLKIFVSEEKNLPIGFFYLLDVLYNENQTVLLKVACDGEVLRIIEGRYMEKNAKDIATSLGIDDFDAALKWWNLCYFRDEGGTVKYDPYYEEFYAANESEKTMSDLHRAVGLWIEDMFVGVEGLIYLLGDFANFNLVAYQLQQKGLKVKTLPIDNSEGVSVINESMMQLRDLLTIPYCDADMVDVSSYTSEGIDICPAKCCHSYLITIPIDLIDINDKAIGSYTYKMILPDGEFCCDYSCCGHNYTYLEMELFADLHCNTVLKTTNSKAESKYTIINKFNYINLQKDGQSN